MRRAMAGVVAAAAVVTAALHADAGAQGADLAGACPEMTADAVPVCTALFPGRLALRLPADGEATYGAFDRRSRFVTASGHALALDDDLDAAFHAFSPSREYASTVYRATIADGRVTALDPALRVATAPIMERVFGSRLLVGRISRRASRKRARPPVFAGRPTLPVVLRISGTAHGATIKASIVNARRATRVSGRCVSALREHRRNPLVASFTRRVEIERIPSMHAPFNDVVTLAWTPDSSGMGEGFYPSIALLFGHDHLAPRWRITQHGVPSSGPSLSLRFAGRSATAARC